MGDPKEVYDFLIGIFCPLEDDYEPGEPECGFLYPAFKNRSGDGRLIDVFRKEPGAAESALLELLGID